MISFEIQPPKNLDKIIRVLSLIPGGLERAANSAIRRTLKGGRQDAGRKIAQRYTSPASLITKTILTKINGLTGEMTSKGSRNPIERFKINPKSRPRKMPPGGVYAQIVRGQGGNIRRAFLQKNGGVYERVGTSRFPLRRFYSPAAPQMLSVPPVSSFIVQKMEQRLGKNLEHEMNAVLGGFL